MGNTTVKIITISNIDFTSPAKPVITPSTLDMVDELTVSINYSSDSYQRQYRFGTSNDWINYTGPITIKQNGIMYARAIDQAGNVSESSTEITNLIASVKYIYNANGRLIEIHTKNADYIVDYDSNGNMKAVRKK
ncbi:hypothetical protein D3C81_1491260 [compost metagenome]